MRSWRPTPLHLLLLVSAAHACVFPTFMRFDQGQSWMSSWQVDMGKLTLDILRGSGNSMNISRRTYFCSENTCGKPYDDNVEATFACVRRVGRHKHRFIVRSTLYGGRKLFCLELVPRQTLTAQDDIKVFFLRWDKRHRQLDDESCLFSSDETAHDVWIPATDAKNRTWWNDCPFTGGYQARMTIGSQQKPLCPDDRLFRFDVECVTGEGMLWVFPRADCNPFANKLESQFYCYLAWRHKSYTNIILFNTSNVAQTYTMRFEAADVKTIFQLLFSRLRSFYKANIYRGAVEVSTGSGVPDPEQHRQFYSLKYRIGNPQDPDCDDEVTNCGELCHETRAYINCKKTCSRPRDECLSNRDNNKCQFKETYVSKWIVHSTSKDQFVTQIKDEEVEIYRPDGTKHMRATCYNEIQSNRASLNDRYIIEVNDMPHGCRRRRLCLELYQGRYIMRSENNRNTLRYRMSRSKIANLYSDHNQLCQFHRDPPPLGSRYRSKFMKMMVSHQRAAERHNLPEKCGFYRSMRASVQRAHNGSILCTNVIINDWSPEECEFDATLHVSHQDCDGRWPKADLVQKFQCVSTFFTSHLGLTVTDGENGNLQVHVTRNLRTKEFNCWFFDKTSPNALLYQFPTSDCVIKAKTPRSITVNAKKASAIYTVTGDGPQPCLKRKERLSPPIVERQRDEEVSKLDQVLLVNDRESMYRRAVQHTNTERPSHSAAALLLPQVPLLLLTALPVSALSVFR